MVFTSTAVSCTTGTKVAVDSSSCAIFVAKNPLNLYIICHTREISHRSRAIVIIITAIFGVGVLGLNLGLELGHFWVDKHSQSL